MGTDNTSNLTSKQLNPPNPTGKGGFRDNPQNRASGYWKKEDTARYKLEKMMQMSEEELLAVFNDRTQPLFERKLSKAIKDGDWRVVREMIHEVYGMPKQTTELSGNDGNAIEVIIKRYEK